MLPEKPIHLMLHVFRARGIMRRYAITNGFDGVLTILGMLTGFYFSDFHDLPVALSACLGAAIALFISGLSSAYLSEKAERTLELKHLEQALARNLDESDYGQASRFLPLLVALSNGFSPLLLSLFILLPLFFADNLIALALSPLLSAIGLAFVCIFLLGVLLGKISQTFWLWAGVRALLLALVTVAIISFFEV
jgi:predicted membrane protein (TIGR00267 family)